MKISLKQIGPSAAKQTAAFLRTVKSNEHETLKRIGYLGRKEMMGVLGHQGSEYKHSNPGQPPYRQTGRLQRSVRYDTDGNSVHVYPNKKSRAFYGDVLQWGIDTIAKRRRPKKYRIGLQGPVAIRAGRVVFARLKTPRQVDAANAIVGSLYTPDGRRTSKLAHIDIGGKRMLERYEDNVKIAARDFVTPTRTRMQTTVDRLLNKVIY